MLRIDRLTKRAVDFSGLMHWCLVVSDEEAREMAVKKDQGGKK